MYHCVWFIKTSSYAWLIDLNVSVKILASFLQNFTYRCYASSTCLIIWSYSDEQLVLIFTLEAVTRQLTVKVKQGKWQFDVHTYHNMRVISVLLFFSFFHWLWVISNVRFLFERIFYSQGYYYFSLLQYVHSIIRISQHFKLVIKFLLVNANHKFTSVVLFSINMKSTFDTFIVITFLVITMQYFKHILNAVFFLKDRLFAMKTAVSLGEDYNLWPYQNWTITNKNLMRWRILTTFRLWTFQEK